MIGASGGEAVRITSEPSDEVLPAWSSDGKWICFASNRTGRDEIWKAPASGGSAVQVTREGAYNLRSVPGEYQVHSGIVIDEQLVSKWRPVPAGHGSLLRSMPAPASPRFLRTPSIAVSPDGRWVALSLTALDRGDLVLLEEVR